MKCDVCQFHIEDYFDGELEGELAGQVTAHLAGCADCSKLFEELKQEQELYARYRRDVEVTPALWAAVEARIGREKAARPAGQVTSFRVRVAGLLGRVFATPRLSPAFAAALVVVAIGATVTVMTLLRSPGNNGGVAVKNNDGAGELARAGGDTQATTAGGAQPPAQKDTDGGGGTANQMPDNRQASQGKPGVSAAHQKSLAANVRPAPQPKVTPEQLVREAEQKYVAAIAILSRDVNRRRSQIDPMVLARFDGALADIDRTIQETRRVVREHPDDPIALQYLLGAYSKKVDVLRDMAAEGQ